MGSQTHATPIAGIRGGSNYGRTVGSEIPLLMKSTVLTLILVTAGFSPLARAAGPVRVLVWDEQQPAQKQAYSNFLGNEIASYLRQQPDLLVKTARLDDPEQGLAKAALDDCDVLVMYNEPFHVPEPDAVILEERWKTGEWFRSGCVWNIGRGKVFYFRPGHEVYPVFKNQNVLRVIGNAVKWLAESK